MDSNESTLYKLLSTHRYTDLDSFNCPVCLNMVLPPLIILCDNFHIVCNSCIPHVIPKICPVCRLPQMESGQRCFEAERILQKLLTTSKNYNSCKFYEYGCTFLRQSTSLEVQEIEDHEQKCPYRIVKKASDLCSWYNDAVYTRLLINSWNLPSTRQFDSGID